MRGGVITFFVLFVALLAAAEARRRGRGRGRGRGGGTPRDCRYNKSDWTSCENGFQTKSKTLDASRSKDDCKPQIIHKRSCPWRVAGCRYVPGEQYGECDAVINMQTLTWSIKKARDGVTCPERVQMTTCSDDLNKRLQNRQARREERRKKRGEKRKAKQEKRKRARAERRQRRRNRRRRMRG